MPSFSHDTATTQIYTLSLHDALPICNADVWLTDLTRRSTQQFTFGPALKDRKHTSELQSRFDLVCRLLLEKKNHPIFQAQSGTNNRTMLRIARSGDPRLMHRDLLRVV